MSEGDSMTEYHLGRKFSTRDQDNDERSGSSCAVEFRGAWWYANHICHESNLNGQYNNTSYKKGVNWIEWTGYYDSLRFTEMKIRPGSV